LPRDVAPPSGGTPPPATAQVRGESIHLAPLADEICRRFLLEFPDDRERYGDAALAWCVHDNRWILGWAAEDLEVGGTHFANNLRWLEGVLRARDYPTERLVRDLELAAEVVGADNEAQRELADKLLQGAELLRGR
jgi:hypothetical protein